MKKWYKIYKEMISTERPNDFERKWIDMTDLEIIHSLSGEIRTKGLEKYVRNTFRNLKKLTEIEGRFECNW